MPDLSSRRGFLASAATAVAGLCAPGLGFAEAGSPRLDSAQAGTPRLLRFNHLHTGEKLEIEYWRDGTYEVPSLGAINHLMRDFRTGDVHEIDPDLLDLLHRVSGMTGTRRPFEIISAYRSPATNAVLRGRSSGVASRSLHLSGRAIDIRLADVPLPQLRRAARAARVGGVGYYPESNFVHVDTGRVRYW